MARISPEAKGTPITPYPAKRSLLPPGSSALTAGCADVDPGMSCMHNRLNRLFGGTVCMHHAIRVNHTEIRCRGRAPMGDDGPPRRALGLATIVQRGGKHGPDETRDAGRAPGRGCPTLRSRGLACARNPPA